MNSFSVMCYTWPNSYGHLCVWEFPSRQHAVVETNTKDLSRQVTQLGPLLFSRNLIYSVPSLKCNDEHSCLASFGIVFYQFIILIWWPAIFKLFSFSMIENNNNFQFFDEWVAVEKHTSSSVVAVKLYHGACKVKELNE